ncbi:5-oxoprolinase subunit PxpB [Winogradskyella sp. A3E31]|uniref:5-oxoprolinase subunit PxpB n=1 Tax=Winogradskyella sp. A3E31 TaxID=3349637 RepID=UPI00398BB0CA
MKYSRYGASGILIEWPAKIDENILSDILNYKKSLQNKYVKEKLYIINTYNSLLINYNFTIDNINDKILTLKGLYSNLNREVNLNNQLWKIPVCYDDDFAIDIDHFSQEKKVSKSDIIKWHSAPLYTVFFIGFLPGFLYLGGLDKRLHFSRRKTPNPSIKKGAVAIGGEQTGIYPQQSPGGWHIIGNSPIEFFDPKKEVPCFAQAGDKIQCVPISLDEYHSISKKVKTGNYQLKPEVYHG